MLGLAKVLGTAKSFKGLRWIGEKNLPHIKNLIFYKLPFLSETAYFNVCPFKADADKGEKMIGALLQITPFTKGEDGKVNAHTEERRLIKLSADNIVKLASLGDSEAENEVSVKVKSKKNPELQKEFNMKITKDAILEVAYVESKGDQKVQYNEKTTISSLLIIKKLFQQMISQLSNWDQYENEISKVEKRSETFMNIEAMDIEI